MRYLLHTRRGGSANLGLVALLTAIGPGCGDRRSDEVPAAPAPAIDEPAAPSLANIDSIPDPVLARRERGKYLATIAGCLACHSPDPLADGGVAKSFSGGLEVRGWFGVWRSPNITPDLATGIGAWTDQQIIDAIRRGIRPDGSALYTAMPFRQFSVLTDEDVRSLVAYLRTVEPVVRRVARNHDLAMPRSDAAPPVQVSAADPAGDAHARGAYLAAVAHCSGCHGGLRAAGVPDDNRPFAGGQRFEVVPPFGRGTTYAANISSHPKHGIGSWSKQEIVGAVRLLRTRKGAAIGFPMLLYRDAWQAMSARDAMLIAGYIKGLGADDNRVQSSAVDLLVQPSPAAGGAKPRASEGPGGGT